jgi:pyridoxamine 5'-phosphate oxidase
MDLNYLRSEFSKGELGKEQVDENPIVQFKQWFKQAVDLEIPEVNAMTIATSSIIGIPSARIVLLKEVDDKGFVFFTNYEGRKSTELEQNPYAALLFFWKELERQIRIEGTVERTGATKSDAYFNSRPLESKISAIVSKQSSVVESREILEKKYVECLKDNFDKDIKRPDNWGGYRVIPEKIEFWQGRTNRLHDRILYKKIDNDWKIVRLEP